MNHSHPSGHEYLAFGLEIQVNDSAHDQPHGTVLRIGSFTPRRFDFVDVGNAWQQRVGFKTPNLARPFRLESDGADIDTLGQIHIDNPHSRMFGIGNQSRPTLIGLAERSWWRSKPESIDSVILGNESRRRPGIGRRIHEDRRCARHAGRAGIGYGWKWSRGRICQGIKSFLFSVEESHRRTVDGCEARFRPHWHGCHHCPLRIRLWLRNQSRAVLGLHRRGHKRSRRQPRQARVWCRRQIVLGLCQTRISICHGSRSVDHRRKIPSQRHCQSRKKRVPRIIEFHSWALCFDKNNVSYDGRRVTAVLISRQGWLIGINVQEVETFVTSVQLRSDDQNAANAAILHPDHGGHRQHRTLPLARRRAVFGVNRFQFGDLDHKDPTEHVACGDSAGNEPLVSQQLRAAVPLGIHKWIGHSTVACDATVNEDTCGRNTDNNGSLPIKTFAQKKRNSSRANAAGQALFSRQTAVWKAFDDSNPVFYAEKIEPVSTHKLLKRS